jgi:hypothetical protein
MTEKDRPPAKGMSKEKQVLVDFQKKVDAGEVTSYDQFPPGSWGFGMLVNIPYTDEVAIFEEMKAVGTKTGIDKEFARIFFEKSKDLIAAGRESEGLTMAYWVGKLIGRSKRKRVADQMKALGVNPHARR